jgi:hypothetical protein
MAFPGNLFLVTIDALERAGQLRNKDWYVKMLYDIFSV